MLTKEIVKQRIRQHMAQFKPWGIASIGLFGSYVRDEQREDSDIDLLITFEKGQETFRNFMQICYLLEEIFPGERVQVVTSNGLSQHIGPKILNEVEYVENSV